MRELRQNTATRVTVGPFVDKTDGFTPEVALTATNEKLTFACDDNGVPTLVIDANATGSGGSNDLVHITGDDAGFYDLELTAAQTNYLGRAILSINYATDHLPVFHEFEIISADAYDEKYTIVGAVPHLGIVDRGVAQSLPSTTTTTLRAAVAFGDNTLGGCVLGLIGSGGATYWQYVVISSNVGSTDVVTHPAFPVAPSGTVTYVIFGSPLGNAAFPVNANVVSIDSDTTTSIAESTAVPSASASFMEKFRWLFTLSRNKITQTATTQLLKADDGTTTVGTSTVSDDGTTATRGEWS